MARFHVDIDYPIEKMEHSRRRMAARGSFRYADRVPIQYCVVPRFFAPIFGLRYMDFFKDAETQFAWQLQFAKYRMERIPEDACCGPTITVHPYFDNVIPPSGHGGEVGWVEDGPPRALPVIGTVDQMERFEVSDPDTGLRGKATQWWQKMKEYASDTKVTFGGREGHVEVGRLAVGGLSPHMIAIDLVGQDFYWWMLEYKEACHRFLTKITQSEILAEEHVRRVDPRPRGLWYGLAEDSAQVMSAELFREFCIPYSTAIFERFGPGGRAIHMCGESRHLHKVLREDMKMGSFDIFGYLVPPRVAAANLGGAVLLWGNINPMLMLNGPPHEVLRAARECVEELGPCGGFMLGDGANVCPGTPLESFHAVMQAAQEYGLGDGRLPRLDSGNEGSP